MDHGGENLEVTVDERAYRLDAIAHKRGMVAYQQVASSDVELPDYPTRQKIEKQVTKAVREHIIVYTPQDHSTQRWQWVKREPGQPGQSRSHLYNREQSGEALIQKLERLVFSIEEEEDLSIVDVSGRVRAAFDVERVTKRFYDRFKTEHQTFLRFIEGILEMADREWYASIMLNRMMFIYFIQKRGFLDGDSDYLRNKLSTVQDAEGHGKFHSFYRQFLLRLFHEGLGQPESNRSPDLTALIGNVPYLNGGLFDVHDLERDEPQIEIPDEAFTRTFDFFDAYQWHLDDRPLHNDNEINPDVLGYIFEKYINQKQMGAYYTKEDITGYISRNTILPYLFDEAENHCPSLFAPGRGVWRLLQDEPDRYFYEAMRHGTTYDVHNGVPLDEKRQLPPDIDAGLEDVSKRVNWNKAAPAQYALPTETWREHVARRERYEEIRAKLASGEVTSINDLITYNLDIEKFTQDVISWSEGPELVRAFWEGIAKVSVLDPTCGSGAFLFAALNILEPIYSACLDAMRQFLEDQKTSKRKHHPESLNDFRRVLDEVASHENETYFILKSIIVNNLYGVDIMEEAVEICKLRLFLKLVAQLENYDQIEPLPDVDFNIRAGNTLVGFASLEEVKRVLGSNLIKQLEIPKIEARAGDADEAFRRFQSMQTQHELNASDFAQTKLILRERLNDLRVELDGYLAGEYGVETEDQEAYDQWRDSHQPFHWFVEFFGITQGGGFDVIIGNPPYVEYSKIKKVYRVNGMQTQKCGNIYAYCIENSLKLMHEQARFGFIVPLSLQATTRMKKLQQLLINEKRDTFLSTFDVYPSKLFEGAKQRLCILVLSECTNESRIFTTCYNRWKPEERSILFPTLLFHASLWDERRNLIPKLGHRTAKEILEKLSKFSLVMYRTKSTMSPSFYVHRIPYNFVKALDFVPYFYSEVDGQKKSADYKPYQLDTSEANRSLLAVLNSNLYFWWWYSMFEGYHCGRHEIMSFPAGVREFVHEITESLSVQSTRLMLDYKRHSGRKKAIYKATGLVEYDEYYPRKSKPIIDEIDRILAQHYDFTDEELDFIINYDIKYRLGR
ncbi:MAG: Eco57I restriction-modification methylase domain-containing protein [Gemmatimonadetes bacterium]|nr:Eco57I restriction-modification methylase domain-containing protein [Gemmatimonadota bacterium]